MDPKKAEFGKAATTNLFHHNQAFHDDYGLVWHNGRTIFLSPVQSISDGNQPNIQAAHPPLPLGKFDDDIVSVCWSRDKTGIHGSSAGSDGTNFLCVHHLDHVSVWTVSGRASRPKCNKVIHQNIKCLPQGCLWHPRKAVLCVVSHTELHVYNAHSACWDVTQCDGKVVAGCWSRDGSKFFLALGSEVKVLEFNTQRLSLEMAKDRTKASGARIDSLQSAASIKTMIPVTDELIAIATDLPLDHLIYQSNQESPHNASLINPRLNLSSSAAVDLTQRTELSSTADDHAQRTGFGSAAVDLAQRTEISPAADDNAQRSAFGSAAVDLTQRTELSSSADDLTQRTEFGSAAVDLTQRTELSSSADDHAQRTEFGSAAVDLTHETEFSLIIPNERIVQNPIATIFKEDFNQRGTLEDNVKIPGRTADGRGSQEAGDVVAHHQDEDRDRGADTVGDKLDQILNLMKKMDTMPKEPERHGHPENGAAAKGGLRSQLETRMKEEGRSGPIDVMALMNETNVKTSLRLNDRTGKLANDRGSIGDYSATDSTARTGEVERTKSHHVVQSDEHKAPGTSMKDITHCEVGGDSGHVETDDVIDLTGLKLNGTNDSLSNMMDTQQCHKSSSPDAAKLTILNMSTSNEPVTLTSVDLQGILTTDLLHYQESSQCFVVGTSTQKHLLVYRWHNNKLEPAKETIMLPDSHRPLGVCDIPGDSTHILVLAGETPPTDGAFLSFSSKTEMNLKWLKFELPVETRTTPANSSAFSDTTILAKDYPRSSTPIHPHTDVDSGTAETSDHLPSRLETTLKSHEVTSADQSGVSESLTPEMACRILLSFHQGHTVPEDQVTAARFVLQSKTPFHGHTMRKQIFSSTKDKETAAQKLLQFNLPYRGLSMPETSLSSSSVQDKETTPRMLLLQSHPPFQGHTMPRPVENRESTTQNLLQSITPSPGHTMPTATPSSSSVEVKETAAQMFSHQSNVPHARTTTSPVIRHHHGNRPWASRIPGGWSSYGSRVSRRDHQKESVERKYPYPEDADVVQLICQGAENEPGVLKTFLLNHQMVKLQVVKDAFGLKSVEMKIGEKWVVLTEDSDGCVPICFPPNSKYTIKECTRTHHQGR